MKRSMFLVFLFSVGLRAGYAQPGSAAHFDASAIFQPGMSAMQQARDICSRGPGSQFGECFVQQMQAAGASPAAVTFMHAVHNDGFMRDFRNAGRVSIAFVYYPFAANENQHCILVNGMPPLIDVDDYQFLPKTELPKNRQYAALLRRYPNLAVFPGDRNGTGFIASSTLPGGAQSFVVPYVLVKGCHACARVGELKLAFQFDSQGKFSGAKVDSVAPTSFPAKP